MRSFTISKIAILGLVLASAPLAAAPEVYADAAGTCSGQSPCFTTIAEAVANAGPAPAGVGIFPGTYAEAVDLSTMGSAIAGAPGTLTIDALDAAGQPTGTGVTIDPPAGVALTTGAGTPFPGNLTISGLTVRSPDSTAMGVIVGGDLVLRDLVATSSPQNGAVAVADGNLTAERVLATLNGAAGLIAAASGEAVLRDVVGLRNGGTGLAVQAELGVLLDGVETEFNEDGLQAASCSELVILDSLVGGNMLTGGTLEAGTPSCEFMGVRNPSAFPGFAPPAFGTEHGAGARGAGGPPLAPSITASDLVVRANGDYGLAVTAPDGPVSLVDVFSFDNASAGIGIEAGSIELDGVDAERNRFGILARAATVNALRINAGESLPMPANPPLDGSGLIVITGSAVLDDIQADNNPSVGLLIFQQAPGTPLTVDLVGSQFDGNDIGVATDSDVPITFTADELFIDNNTTFGMNLVNLGQAELARVEAFDNGLGLLLDVAGTLRVERSEFGGNDTGVALSVDSSARAVVVCSDFAGNTAGLELGVGDAADASANYWGEAGGPTHPGNPAGAGDPILDSATGSSGNVTYTPFLTAPATDADCLLSFPEAIAVPTLGPTGRGLLVLLFALTALLAMRLRWG